MEFQHIPWGGVLELSKKNRAPRDLFNCIHLQPPNILLHPPSFEILQNILIGGPNSLLQRNKFGH